MVLGPLVLLSTGPYAHGGAVRRTVGCTAPGAADFFRDGLVSLVQDVIFGAAGVAAGIAVATIVHRQAAKPPPT
jgi:hypothetical protein